MAASEWYHQKMAIAATIDPVNTATATTLYTDGIDMDVFEKAIFIVAANTIAANTTAVLTVMSGTAATVSAMTNTVATSGTLTNGTDDSQMWVEVDTEDFNVDARHRYCGGVLTVAGTGGTIDHIAVIGLGANTRYHPASDYDLATVTSITNS